MSKGETKEREMGIRELPCDKDQALHRSLDSLYAYGDIVYGTNITLCVNWNIKKKPKK